MDLSNQSRGSISSARTSSACTAWLPAQVFVTRTQAELQAGKAKWEGRNDASLVDFINTNLGYSYRHLNRLLQLLYMGDRVETDEVELSLECQA